MDDFYEAMAHSPRDPNARRRVAEKRARKEQTERALKVQPHIPDYDSFKDEPVGKPLRAKKLKKEWHYLFKTNSRGKLVFRWMPESAIDKTHLPLLSGLQAAFLAENSESQGSTSKGP